jgi:hypothetical protein
MALFDRWKRQVRRELVTYTDETGTTGMKMSQAVPYLRNLSNQFPMPIEVLGLITGDNDECLTHFWVARVLGILTNRRDILDNLIGHEGPTKAMLAVDLSVPKNGLGIKMSYCAASGRNQETTEFFGADMVIPASDMGLASYLRHDVIRDYFPNIDLKDITSAQLERLVRDSGVRTTICDMPYLYFPVPLTAEAYGSENCFYNTDAVVRHIVSMNQCEGGTILGDIHLHYAQSRRTASAEQLAIMNAVGNDYFRFPSSYDFLKFISSQSEFEKALNSVEGDGIANSGLKKSARLVLRGIIALTPQGNPERDMVGMSFLDVNTLEDRKLEKEATDAAKVANSEDATVQDKIRYFSIVKNMVSDRMPDYVDMSG